MTKTGIYVFSKGVLMLQSDRTGSMHLHSCLSVAFLSVHNVCCLKQGPEKKERIPSCENECAVPQVTLAHDSS